MLSMLSPILPRVSIALTIPSIASLIPDAINTLADSSRYFRRELWMLSMIFGGMKYSSTEATILSANAIGTLGTIVDSINYSRYSR